MSRGNMSSCLRSEDEGADCGLALASAVEDKLCARISSARVSR